jgi:hypothetical protein
VTLDWAILCNGIESKGGLLTLIGVQWDTAWSPDYPATFGGVVVLRFIFEPGDHGSMYPIEARFVSADGKQLAASISAEVAPPALPPDWVEGSSTLASNVAMIFGGLPVQEPGRYEVQIVHEGHVLKVIPFWARRGSGPSGVIT